MQCWGPGGLGGVPADIREVAAKCGVAQPELSGQSKDSGTLAGLSGPLAQSGQSLADPAFGWEVDAVTRAPALCCRGGTLILRDLELLRQAAQVTDVGVSVSVGFTDERLWRTVEPATPSPQRRLDAVRTLTDSGIGCGVLMAPVIPFLGNSADQLRATVGAIAASGATSVTPLVLQLRLGAREWFMQWLREHHAYLVPRCERLYAEGAYAPKWYQRRITRQVHELTDEFGIGPAGRGRGS